MNIREDYKNKIDEIPTTSFNKDQKEIAKKLLDACDINDIENVYKLLIHRVKTGFVFDSAPATNNQSISLLKYNEKLSLNDLNKDQKPFDENGLTNDNLLIIGENYDALKNLLLVYRNKIDIIYIDPPYNTDASVKEKNNLSEEEVLEKQSTKFVYRDKFSRTGWLNMMQDRLYLAKDLLSEDGVIFVSIDDNEQAYLKVLMDEIFGEENFETTFCWIKKHGPGGNTSMNYKIVKNTEYIHVYSKNSNKKIFNYIVHNNETLKKLGYTNKDEYLDERGRYKLTYLYHPSSTGSFQYTESLDYPIIAPDGTEFYLHCNKDGVKRGRYTWGYDAYKEGAKLGFIHCEKNNDGDWVAYRKQYQYVKFDPKKKQIIKIEAGQPYENIIDDFYSSNGGAEIIQILEDKNAFSFPKPKNLIKYIIGTAANRNSIILDFFAGSGTTAQAAMELNEEDGGNRKFILVTNNAEILDDKGNSTGKHIAIDVTYERLHRITKGVGTKGESDFEWIKKRNPYKTNNIKVFDIEYKPVTIHDDVQPIYEQFKNTFRMLDQNINIDDDSIINKLFSLHPYKKEDGDK